MKESNLERRGEKSAIRQRRQIVASECLGLNCSAEVLSSRQSFSRRTSFGVRERATEREAANVHSVAFRPHVSLPFPSCHSRRLVFQSSRCKKQKNKSTRSRHTHTHIITDSRKQASSLHTYWLLYYFSNNKTKKKTGMTHKICVPP